MPDPTQTATTLPSTSRLSSADKAKLWAAADTLRGHMDAAEYKHTVLGFLVQRRPGPTCAAW
ncbi:MAG: type I restriction-modification system subunit M N-terminal domain-containing protein [Chloroflexota bacterium]|nr:type I restriction-modification system subunit M N-terminal domain-containing protein [Chloroflexota bacterium]